MKKAGMQFLEGWAVDPLPQRVWCGRHSPFYYYSLKTSGLSSVPEVRLSHFVECHRANVMRKLKVRKNTELVRYAINHDIV